MPLALTAVFADLPDPRIETANELHKLTDILVIATRAVIAGAEGREDIAEYGTSKEPFFRRFLELPNGIPSHDTFERVFAKLDPDAFADRFGRWMSEPCVSTDLVHVAIDGKSIRGSAKAFTGCLHLVEAWAVENRLILGQRSVPDGGHEITTAPDLLAALDLRGAVVTIDAAFCQKAIIEQIRRQGGDYVACVKGNQKCLRDAVAGVFERAGETAFADRDMAGEVGAAHGRVEERYVSVVQDPEGMPAGGTDVGSVALVCRERRVAGTSNESGSWYYLSSLRVSAEVLAGYIRNHRGIENGLHWCSDVSFREDQSRTRAGHAAANLAMLRRVALSLRKRTKVRGSIRTRRTKAAWDDDYLLQVLQGIKAH